MISEIEFRRRLEERDFRAIPPDLRRKAQEAPKQEAEDDYWSLPFMFVLSVVIVAFLGAALMTFFPPLG